MTVNGCAATPQDVLRFDATSLGANTAGMFSMYLDGSDVGLDASADSIDALGLLPDGRLSISTRFAFVFLLAIGMVAVAFYMILDRIYLNQLKSQAETVADNVDAFGTWVAQYGRVWVKDDARSFLGHLPVYQMEDGVAAGASGLKPIHFYSKNPALAQREFSEVVARSSSPAKFRLTSHNVMNPGNAPDPFETAALQRIRDGGLREYFELTPVGFRYARALYHKASCISCHGDVASAPSDVKLRYGTNHGFGFKEGEVAGVISVSLPARSFWQVAVIIVGGWQLVMILGAFVIAIPALLRGEHHRRVGDRKSTRLNSSH